MFSIFLRTIVTLISLASINSVKGSGIEKFVVQLCNEYPSWLAINYPDPSPQQSNPINVTLTKDNVTGSFTQYQLSGHSNPQSWNFTNWNVQASSSNEVTIELVFNLRKTKFTGNYQLEGVYNGSEVKGHGSWNMTTKDTSYIHLSLHYYSAKITEDGYLDLNTAQAVISFYAYLSQDDSDIGFVSEMDGLIAGGHENSIQSEILLEILQETQFENEHPLFIPLNAYLQVAFMVSGEINLSQLNF